MGTFSRDKTDPALAASLLSSSSYQCEQLLGVALLVQETGYAVVRGEGRHSPSAPA